MTRVLGDKPEETSTPSAERLMKALRVIECVAADNETLPQSLDTDKEEVMHADIRRIFRIAHAAREPSCMDAHPDWEEELQNLIEQLDA